jgi:hypothetical protein
MLRDGNPPAPVRAGNRPESPLGPRPSQRPCAAGWKQLKKFFNRMSGSERTLGVVRVEMVAAGDLVASKTRIGKDGKTYDITDLICNDLQSSATRPDFIARFRPAFGETVGVHEPAIGETQPGLTETNLQSSDLAHIP